MSEETFWFFGHQIIGHKLEGSLTMGYRKFRAFFGTSPEVCAILWNKLFEKRPQNSSPIHLLWGLMLPKEYQIESVNSTLVGVTEKTFRKWSMLYISLLAVQYNYFKNNSSELIYIFYITLTGSLGLIMLQKTRRLSFRLMAQTLGFRSKLHLTANGIRISSMALAFDTKLGYASGQDTSFGPMEVSHVVNGRTLK